MSAPTQPDPVGYTVLCQQDIDYGIGGSDVFTHPEQAVAAARRHNAGVYSSPHQRGKTGPWLAYALVPLGAVQAIGASQASTLRMPREELRRKLTELVGADKAVAILRLFPFVDQDVTEHDVSGPDDTHRHVLWTRWVIARWAAESGSYAGAPLIAHNGPALDGRQP